MFRTMKVYNIVNTEYNELNDGLSTLKYLELILFITNTVFCCLGIYGFFKVSNCI